MVFALAFSFAGFGVYWLLTGSTTVGVGGTVSNLGALVWFAPMAIAGLVLFVGDRGPLRWFFETRATIGVGPDGLAWSTPLGAGSIEWSDLGGISRMVAGRRDTRETVFDQVGVEVVMLRGPFVLDGSTGIVALPTVVVQERPDLFASLDAQHPEWGCVRRDRLGLPSAVRET